MSSAQPSAARAFLSACARHGLRLGLTTSRALLAALGHPERAYPVLLVAGTNGKGSVVAMVEAVLRAAGLRTGRFTSPALRLVEEHIALDGASISEAAFDQALEAVRVASRGVDVEPSAFEALSAAAFLAFREAHVQVAVVEVGVGGREDATNACEPVASAIVSVDLDHEDVLGAGLAAIAHAKAGVLRAGRPTVLGGLPTVARTLIERQARHMRAVLVDAPSSVSLLAQPGASGLFAATTARARYPDLRPLPGAHQHGNLCVALALLEVAAEAGLPWDADALARGLATTHWPGRLQRVAGRPELLLDGAHNPAAALALAAHLADQPPHVLLFAVMRDKDVAGLAHALFPLARAVVLTRAPSAGPRGADASEVAARLGHLAPACHVDERLPRALATAEALAGPAGLVIVAGSLALVGDVLGLLEARARGA